MLDTTRALDALEEAKAGLDLSPILTQPESAPMDDDRHCNGTQDHGLDIALDMQLIERCPRPRSTRVMAVSFDLPIEHVNRTVGTMLGHGLTKRHGGEGLPDDTIDITFTGSAGQLRRVRASAA